MDSNSNRAWEDEIDMDDSDLRSLHLLRPCSTSHPDSQRAKPTPTPTPSPPSRPRKRQLVIPGPAGATQAAMHRRTAIVSHPHSNQRGGGGFGSPLDVAAVADVDFNLAPWLRALEFLDEGKYSARSVCINQIKTSTNVRRVEQVVGIVTFCRPNGLGGLFLTLKDPTGTVGAFVHHKVVAHEVFGRKELGVGCVLILEKVVVFTVRTTAYLNLTLNNMVKLISKDCEAPQRSAMTANITPGKTTEFGKTKEDDSTFRPLIEYPSNVSLTRERVSVRSETTGATYVAEELPKDFGVEVSQDSKDKRTEVNIYHQTDENSICSSSSSDVTTCTHADEARKTPLVVVVEGNLHNQAATGGKCIYSNATEPTGRLSSGTRTSSHSTFNTITTLAPLQSRHAVGQAHVDKEMGVITPKTKNSTTTGSLTTITADLVKSSSVKSKASDKDREAESLISKVSVTGWTDEQIQELFSDYQDADDMNMLLL